MTDPIESIESELALIARVIQWLHRPGYEAMTRSSYLIARTLEQLDEASINTLAQTLGIDASTMTRQVAMMDKAGFIRRSSDPNDGRVQLISLSPLGRREMRKLRSVRYDKLREFTADWDDGERVIFAELLGRLTKAAIDSPTFVTSAD